MFSLAPVRYAEVLSQYGGPVERLEYAPTRICGMACTQAVTYLRGDLVPDSVRPKTQTRQPDGAGSHRSVQIACHMAVSEALERWAVLHCRAFPDSTACGMELDGSSNGFAAFPGLFRRQARKAAFRESIERHCLICWWEGLLGHHPLPDPQPDVRAIQLENPFSRHAVVVIWTFGSGGYSYAFGAGGGLNQAVWRALVELERTQMLLDQLAKARSENAALTLTDLYERRVDYFSTEVGFERFLKRLEARPKGGISKLRLLFDGEVSGPWERYATVWRTVVEPPTQTYSSRAADYFFW